LEIYAKVGGISYSCKEFMELVKSKFEKNKVIHGDRADTLALLVVQGVSQQSLRPLAGATLSHVQDATLSLISQHSDVAVTPLDGLLIERQLGTEHPWQGSDEQGLVLAGPERGKPW
jgi:hypothetical protein